MHPELHYLIVWGKEVKGHQRGQALLLLHKNGMNNDDRIIGARGPYPILRASEIDTKVVRRQIRIFDIIGIDDFEKVKNRCCSTIDNLYS